MPAEVAAAVAVHLRLTADDGYAGLDEAARHSAPLLPALSPALLRREPAVAPVWPQSSLLWPDRSADYNSDEGLLTQSADRH